MAGYLCGDEHFRRRIADVLEAGGVVSHECEAWRTAVWMRECGKGRYAVMLPIGDGEVVQVRFDSEASIDQPQMASLRTVEFGRDMLAARYGTWKHVQIGESRVEP